MDFYFREKSIATSALSGSRVVLCLYGEGIWMVAPPLSLSLSVSRCQLYCPPRPTLHHLIGTITRTHPCLLFP
jgi:hypothetical protein